MSKIILSKPIINIPKQQNIKICFKSSFVNEGQQTQRFENKICKFLNVKFAVTTTSGTTALFLALKACGINNGMK